MPECDLCRGSMQSEIDQEASDLLDVSCVPCREQDGEMGQVGLEAMLLEREKEGVQYGGRTVTDAFLRSALLHADSVRVSHVGAACAALVSLGPRAWTFSLQVALWQNTQWEQGSCRQNT